ncbi:type II pantothenate kinase [Clonorchis sinensis]|uniref:4'-phosphopantetheine phosphatase n=1 Tax=Clonorchis sinensis TaxID=79923 RepID=G7Y4P3_CLOSI|nr:type II pantothenate kinase [Clonorchis sinensis]
MISSGNGCEGGRQSLPHKVSRIPFALDIGGSLAKLVYERTFRYNCPFPCRKTDTPSEDGVPSFPFYDYREREHEGRKMCFVKFETSCINECLAFIRSNILDIDSGVSAVRDFARTPIRFKVTGGGAYRFRELIVRELGVEFDKEDEMECLIRGCIFMLRNIPDELFRYDKRAIPAHVFVPDALVDTFPFLLVNIGSGVSILKVESPVSYSRLGGSSIGGGTFWGLGTALSGGKYTFDELLELAVAGDHRKVDMLVRDIYGGDYALLGLPGDAIASSFGLAARSPDNPRCSADILKSLLIAVSNNIGQLACLYAKQHNLTRILFGGFFIRGHGLTMELITFAVNFWSAGAHRALFLRHEGYLGAIGAFIKAVNDSDESKTVWSENYVAGSREAVGKFRIRCRENSLTLIDDGQLGPPSPAHLTTNFEGPSHRNFDLPEIPESEFNGLSIAVEDDGIGKAEKKPRMRHSLSLRRIPMDSSYLELDRVLGHSLEPLPLLEHPTRYTPDTWDLTQDEEARTYWLACLERGVERHRIKAEESQCETMPDASERSHQYADRYIGYLHELGKNPSSSGALTVRSLLSAQQHFLREFGFGDPFCIQKKLENHSALQEFPSFLKQLSQLSWADRQMSLVRALLGGNVFDWGAEETVKFFREARTDKFGVPNMEVTLSKIPPRPWLVDDYDKWIEAIRPDKQAYRCVLIFCDNSGPDVILGVLPLALEFISRGSKVILAANSAPAINDVTFEELEILLRLIAVHEPSVARALDTKHLLVTENGQIGPCLDLRLTASTLVQLVKREQVDLIVIEGMGRAVHTNLYARFRVDSLKVAVIKNAWLARRLGGELYGVLFKFERGSENQLSDETRENTPTLNQGPGTIFTDQAGDTI